MVLPWDAVIFIWSHLAQEAAEVQLPPQDGHGEWTNGQFWPLHDAV